MSLKEKRTKKLKKNSSRKKIKSENASSSDEDSEHELFYYANDRVQLMKEVIKTLKSKKIKALAPVEIKKLDIEEINTMLLEELLGISSKRLKKIFDGQVHDDASSSSSEEDGDKPISLDDISDDDDISCMFVDSPSVKNKKDPKNDKSKNSKKHRIKNENIEKDIKEEKQTNSNKPTTEKKGPENEKLLSVLELLELQARARAIRSQLAIEAENKTKATEPNPEEISDDDDEAIIIESPKTNEIVISSSDSEPEKVSSNTGKIKPKKIQKIKINRSRINAVERTSEESDDNEDQQKDTIGDSNDESHPNEIVSEIPLPINVNESVENCSIDNNQIISNENVEKPVNLPNENEASTGNTNKSIETPILEKCTVEQERNKNQLDNTTDKSDDDNVIHCDIVEIEDFDD